MAQQYRISKDARMDLAEIFAHIAEDSVAAARHTNKRFHQAFATLAKMPGIGRERRDFAPGIRSLPVEDYLIYYRETRNTIVISRVIHGNRDQRTAWGRRD